MRSQMVAGLTLATGVLLFTAPLSSQETRFSPTLRVGQHLDISTVDGDVTVTHGEGRTAEIIATKRVRSGEAARVKAVMEQTDDGYRVCTIYLHRGDGDRDSCTSRSQNNWRSDDGDDYDIEMSYTVRLPAGVVLGVNTVDGNVDVRGVDVGASIRTVDGDVVYEGPAPRGLHTVEGDIRATITGGDWSSDVNVRTVDGSIDISLPADIAISVRGTTVDGSFHSDFPMTLQGKWGPRSIGGDIGGGGPRALRLSSVDGDITLRRR